MSLAEWHYCFLLEPNIRGNNWKALKEKDMHGQTLLSVKPNKRHCLNHQILQTLSIYGGNTSRLQCFGQKKKPQHFTVEQTHTPTVQASKGFVVLCQSFTENCISKSSNCILIDRRRWVTFTNKSGFSFSVVRPFALCPNFLWSKCAAGGIFGDKKLQN